MANFEIGYCSIDEYRQGEPARVMEDDLCVDGLYTVMFSLRTGASQPAAKYPADVLDVERLPSGLTRVEFTILDADLDPVVDAEAKFRDGFWRRTDSEALAIGGQLVTKGYFRADYTELDPEQEFQDSIQRGSRRPACVR